MEQQNFGAIPLPSKNVDVFTFDDLMVACSQEIMVNGIDSESIPSTIRDWISGKIVRALPKRLIQKLLAFLIDNRDMTETLGFREKANGDVPEFTLLLYRTAKARARHEKAEHENGGPIENESFRNQKAVPIFEQNDASNPGLKFFSDEILVDQSQVIPQVQTFVNGTVRNKNKVRNRKRKLMTNSSEEDDDEEDEILYNVDISSSDDDNPENTVPKKKLTVDYLAERVQCHLCDRSFAQNSYLYKHYKDAHPKYLATRQPIGGEDNKFCSEVLESSIKCQICSKPYSSSHQLRIHQKKKHPKFWEKREVIDKRITPRMEIERGDYPELVYDAETNKFTCKPCGKQDWRPDRIILHVTTVHRKTIQAECDLCGKQFLYKRQLQKHMLTHTGNYPYKCLICNKGYSCRWKYAEEHCKKHHPDLHAKYKSGELEVPCYDESIKHKTYLRKS